MKEVAENEREAHYFHCIKDREAKVETNFIFDEKHFIVMSLEL